MAILNDAFMASDILLVEEGALAEGTELTNEPGAVVKLKQNAMGRVQRLGGLQSLANASVGIEWFKTQIERANRNYDTSMGREAARVTTATCIAMLRSDAQGQADIKKADRNAGFERLYELLDWLALEFFDDDRMLFLGADPNKDRAPERLIFNSEALSERLPEVRDLEGMVVRESWTYWPRVDREAQQIADQWPALREELISRGRNLYTLKYIDMKPGTAPGELWLVTSDQIYLNQLNMQGGEKLKLIADFIRQKTGRNYTIRLVKPENDQAARWTREDYIRNIHMDINFQ